MDVGKGLVIRKNIKVDLRYTIIRGTLILHVNTNGIRKLSIYLPYCKANIIFHTENIFIFELERNTQNSIQHLEFVVIVSIGTIKLIFFRLLTKILEQSM